MHAVASSLRDLRLLGGRLALDFANTIDPRDGTHRREYLRGYEDLVGWGARAGLLTAAAARRLLGRARRQPRDAARAFRRAMTLREAVYRAFAAIAGGRQASSADLGLFSANYREALAHAKLAQSRGRFGWRLEEALDAVAWEVARDAVALLESDGLGRVKRCPGSGDCGWLFLDASKNGSRRWCSMESCGNRAKARRHARRRRLGGR